MKIIVTYVLQSCKESKYGKDIRKETKEISVCTVLVMQYLKKESNNKQQETILPNIYSTSEPI